MDLVSGYWNDVKKMGIQSLGSDGEMIYECDSGDYKTCFLVKFVISAELEEH